MKHKKNSDDIAGKIDQHEMPGAASDTDIQKIIRCEHHHPASVLGPHALSTDQQALVAIRAFLPTASKLEVLVGAKGRNSIPMRRRHQSGFFECVLENHTLPLRYRLRATGHDGRQWEYDDPYRFASQLQEDEIHSFLRGEFFDFYKKFGAHPMTIDGVKGVNFVVWAPNATRVSVIGDFNQWDGRFHPMNVHAYSGIWELFIPGFAEGTLYKFEIRTADGALRIKTDPLAFRCELRPANASIVHRLGTYRWKDREWMNRRKKTEPYQQALAIYEVHLGSWKRKAEEENRRLTYRELAHELADYVAEMGFTHVELLPVAEHPYDGSWGYQVTGYFAPTSRYGSPDDFKYFVDHLHQKGIGVIVDWVPAHFPRDDFALRRFDGTALYEHDDPRLGEHPDWGTLIFNYGRYEVANFLISNALFWFDEYHIDGLRVDAVASMLYLDYSRKEGEWIPNTYGGRENLDAIAFLKRLNETIFERFPHVLMIAEESTAWPAVSRPTYLGGLGFNFKWNMGWMNDFLEYMRHDPIHRKYHHNKITFSLWYAFSENFILVLSHDEVVHGKGSLISKMPGDVWQKFANLRLALGYMYGHPGKKLLFMGSEIGQWREWDYQSSLDWHLLEYEPHQQLQQYVRDLNALYRQQPALWAVDFSPEGFQWIEFQDADQSVIAFLRRGLEPTEELVFVCNFTPVPRMGYRIGVPKTGFYQEIFNSDSAYYGGSNLGNAGGLQAESVPYHGLPASIVLTIPPLAVTIFKHRSEQT